MGKRGNTNLAKIQRGGLPKIEEDQARADEDAERVGKEGVDHGELLVARSGLGEDGAGGDGHGETRHDYETLQEVPVQQVPKHQQLDNAKCNG